ncbi:hypothetical protein [Methylobacterium indicum]|uniref:Uncharacterized protein n=1 Tax=Methylobacterium indicum TaxID=1775910 RepID=A0ABR5HEP8_9HYPH|nr:hypothetical protein [Methylobacterium indicum]KMO18869.1 hypothetical protein QR78_14205 [Methylobacterium indicum]KMO25027.1 hypothetical protein QR79_09595 [Methylobacterium indicum]
MTTIVRDDVQCRCVGSLGPNPECGGCGGSGCITAEVPTPDGVIKERGEDGRTWDEGITYGLQRLCAVLGVDPSKVSWDAATETVEGDVRSVIGNILCAWAGDDWQDLPAIREMLLQGQGDDDGSRILPDFQEDMTVHAMVAACVHLLERRRDALDGYATANVVAPTSTVQPPSSQESGVGETEDWVLVPREPTPEMTTAAKQHHNLPTSSEDHRISIYRAMIAAAPRPSQREG